MPAHPPEPLAPAASQAPANTRPRNSGQALEKAMLYLTWLTPTLENFPKSQRFLLGDRLQTLAMDVVELVVEATYDNDPLPLLRQVNLALEKQRMFVRLAYNLEHLDARRYEFAARHLDTIGQSVGAWGKATKLRGMPRQPVASGSAAPGAAAHTS